MNTPIEEHPYLLTLSSCPGIGPIHAKKLLLSFGSARKCIEAKKIDWVQKGGLSSKQAENLNTHRRNAINAKKKDSEYYHKQGIRIISILDDNFPVRLKHWIDCPILLFTKGNIELNPLRTLAIIGTRKPNGMSIELTKKLIDDCTQHNITIVSGLAYGIDITRLGYLCKSNGELQQALKCFDYCLKKGEDGYEYGTTLGQVRQT